MVVEPTNTPVARPTVLRVILHVRLAHLTVKLEALAVERFVNGFVTLLNGYRGVSGVRFGGFVSIIDHSDHHQAVNYPNYAAECLRITKGHHANEVEGVAIKKYHYVCYHLEGVPRSAEPVVLYEAGDNYGPRGLRLDCFLFLYPH